MSPRMWLLAAALGSAILGIGYVSERAHTERRYECLRRGGEPVDTGRMGRNVVCLRWGAVLP
jgi:hypothetical protein